jgi:hypothetical protein
MTTCPLEDIVVVDAVLMGVPGMILPVRSTSATPPVKRTPES